jgi:predicted membrane protein (TIGR00267 family)
MSGVTSAYISESAEKRSELLELEQALLMSLEQSEHGKAARIIPLYIAAVNGLAPIVIALFIISPLWLAFFEIPLPLQPLQLAIILAFFAIFLIGVFLGRISGGFWLWSAIKTSFIALLTAGIIFLVES